MKPGEVVHWHDGKTWHRVRVLSPLGCSPVSSVLFVYLRSSDYQRVVVYRSGKHVEVAR